MQQDRIGRYFEYGHLSQPMRGIVMDFRGLLERLNEEEIVDETEFAVGRRKLLEAKDCFARAVLPKEQV